MCGKEKVVRLKRQDDILPSHVIVSNKRSTRFIEKYMTLPYRPEKETIIIFYAMIDEENHSIPTSVREYDYVVDTQKMTIWLVAENEKGMDLLLKFNDFEIADWHKEK